MRTPKTALLPAALALLAATPAHAGQDTQYWQTVDLKVNLGDGFGLQNELVVRQSDAKGLYEVENVSLLSYKLGKLMTVAAGYVHNPQYNHSNFTIMERRAREQVTFDNFATIGKVKLTGRLRMEQRWRDGLTGTGWRLRPYIKATMPFVGKTTLNLSHESFVNLNTTGFQKVSGYDRMRNAISVSAPVGKHVKLDLGYLNQLGIVRGGPNNSDHVITTALSLTF